MARFSRYFTDQNLKEVSQKSLIFLLFKVSGFFFGYLFTILITRSFGEFTYGLVTLAFTVFMIFSVISKLGFDINITRLISSGKYSKNEIRKTYTKAMSIAFLSSSFLAAIFIINRNFISSVIFKSQDLNQYLFWSALAIPLWTIVLINAGVFRGLKNNFLFSLFSSFGRFGLASLLLIFYLLLYHGANPISPIIAHFICVCVLAITSSVLVFRFLNNREGATTLKINFNTFFAESFPIFISSAVFIILGWIDRIFLGIFETEDKVALFDVSAKLALLVGFSLEAINSILAPKVSELYYSKKTKELKNTIYFATLINGVVSIVVFIILLLFSDPILMVFGAAFVKGKTILLILSFGQLFNCLSGSVGVILQMTGNQKTYRQIMVYALIANLLLNFAFIKPFGVTGVAIATALSLILWNVIGIYLIRKKLSINSYFNVKLNQ